MHCPGFLSSIHNEPLGILGVVFPGTHTRFILPYEASLPFRNPFRFRLPLHTSSRPMQLPSTRGCLPKAPQQTFTVEFIIMSNARRVGVTGYPVTPLSEPDWRISHPALWMLFQNANNACASEAAGRLCFIHSPTSDFRRPLNQTKP